jgi:integrase
MNQTQITVVDPLEPVRRLAADACSSPLTKARYGAALEEFFRWKGELAFNRATVMKFRAHLEERGLAASSINVRLSALRLLAREAVYSGHLDATIAQGVRDIRGAKMKGIRTGNWLTKPQTESLLAAPDTTTNAGKRDLAILAVLIGGALRRTEAARLTIEHVQQREGRWCVVDLIGKHGRVRTVPIPSWTKVAIDAWTAAANISSGLLFRGVNKGDHVTGESLTSQGVWRCVEKYSAQLGLTFSPHDLRRTHAKLARKGGASLEDLQRVLGHASVVTTDGYVGREQDLTDAPCDHLGIRIERIA